MKSLFRSRVRCFCPVLLLASPQMPVSPSTFRAFALRSGLAAMAAVALSGCQSIQSTSPTSPEIRFVDASPNNAKGLDFYLNANAQAYNLGFGTNTNYISTTTGTYTAKAVADGTTQTLASTTVTANSSQHYTVLAGNVPASLELNAFTDQSTPAPTGEIDIRLLDQSQNSGAVDVYFVPQGGKLITTNASITGLTFDANSGYIPLPAGSYQIAIVPTGTVPIATTVTLITGSQTAYTAGDAVTIVLLDNPGVTTPAVQLDVLKPYDYGS